MFSPLIIFSLIMFFISLADGIMSYVAPVYIEKFVSNSFIMGLIISFSSLVGIVCDFLFSKWFPDKPYTFFIWNTLLLAIAFPLSLLFFPPTVTVFLVAMAIWGIYYELIGFSNFHFIAAFQTHDQYASSWGLLESFKSAAYMIGPLLAGLLININFKLSFTATIGFGIASIFGFTVFLKSFHHHRRIFNPVNPHKPSFLHTFRAWSTLWRKIWPIYLFLFTLSTVSSTFWTVGTLLSESLRDLHPYGGLLISAHMLPSVFIGFLAGFAARPFGKKRAAFLAGLLSGLILIPIGFVSNIPILLTLVFLSSAFGAVCWPEISATFEDYVIRLGKSGEDMIGLQSSAISLSYIIGPVIAGFVATQIGNQFTFSVVGLTLALVSIFALIFVPRKIHLPQNKLTAIPD